MLSNLLAYAAAIAVQSALGTTVLALQEDQLSQRADTVVVLRVVRTEGLLLEGRITTIVEAQVEKNADGEENGNGAQNANGAQKNIGPLARGKTLLISLPGGKMPDGRRLSISGVPKVTSGDRVVAFLERGPTVEGLGQLWRPLGLAYSWYRIQGRDKAAIVSRSLSGLTLKPARTVKAKQAFSAGKVSLQSESLDTFWSRLRSRRKQQTQGKGVQQ